MPSQQVRILAHVIGPKVHKQLHPNTSIVNYEPFVMFGVSICSVRYFPAYRLPMDVIFSMVLTFFCSCRRQLLEPAFPASLFIVLSDIASQLCIEGRGVRVANERYAYNCMQYIIRIMNKTSYAHVQQLKRPQNECMDTACEVEWVSCVTRTTVAQLCYIMSRVAIGLGRCGAGFHCTVSLSRNLHQWHVSARHIIMSMLSK